ncbi:nucleolar protein 11 [Leptinotarsa decemlineata]|uniref:nucleolar protein 11 n=1 Tax=Leptinotarsa decemlineata TaxID=7539 RepID=UPI003D304E72
MMSWRGFSISCFSTQLGSGGTLYAFPLEQTVSDSGVDDVGRLFSVVESVSPKHPVSMISLDDNYIALHGANYNEEGAVLVIYNTQFRVRQSKQPFELFTSNAKVWKIENNILLPMGQNLAVIPFDLETEQLTALFGSHKVWQDGLDLA